MKFKVNDYVVYDHLKNRNKDRPPQHLKEGEVYKIVRLNNTLTGQIRCVLFDSNNKRIPSTYSVNILEHADKNKIKQKGKDKYVYNNKFYYLVYENHKVKVLEHIDDGSIVTALSSERITLVPNREVRIFRLYQKIRELNIPEFDKNLLIAEIKSLLSDEDE